MLLTNRIGLILYEATSKRAMLLIKAVYKEHLTLANESLGHQIHVVKISNSRPIFIDCKLLLRTDTHKHIHTIKW